jgi:hypothetical protein
MKQVELVQSCFYPAPSASSPSNKVPSPLLFESYQIKKHVKTITPPVRTAGRVRTANSGTANSYEYGTDCEESSPL